MKKGFTLIELMIVVAIIAIIAAIAIPNLLESRMQANETNAIGALKQYATAENNYMKANYSASNGLDPKEYCQSFANLGGTAAHVNGAGTALELVGDAFGNATLGEGYQGYYFTDDGNVANWKYEFGLYADPCLYEKTGINSFHIGTQGTILMQDLAGAGSGGAADVSAWTIP